MDSFLEKFFPEVHRKQQADRSTNQYCQFDSQLLQTFTSSLYLAALVASFFASAVTRAFGRKWSMFGGGITFLVGATLNGAAKDVAMLIIGRILLGIGVGFANQVPYSLLLDFTEMLCFSEEIFFSLQILALNFLLPSPSIFFFPFQIQKPSWGTRLTLILSAFIFQEKILHRDF